MKKLIIILLASLVINLWGLDENAGTTGFAFSKLNFSPRAAAMGYAYAGIANDHEAVFYNPAGLFQLKDKSITAAYMNYIADINCGSIIYSYPIKESLALSFYSKFLSTEETRTLSDPQGNYMGTQGNFGASSLELGGAVSYHFSDKVNLGTTFKYLYDSLDSNSASALAMDFGIYHITTNEKVHLGIVIRNIGVQLSSYTSSDFDEKLPSVFDLGFGYRMHPRFLIGADLYKPLNSDFYERFGVEYIPPFIAENRLKLRLGYKTDGKDWQNDGNSDALSGFSGGFNINWYKYSLDYSVLSNGNLGIVNQVSLTYKF